MGGCPDSLRLRSMQIGYSKKLYKFTRAKHNRFCNGKSLVFSWINANTIIIVIIKEN